MADLIGIGLHVSVSVSVGYDVLMFSAALVFTVMH
jgi:hypothetical protein